MRSMYILNEDDEHAVALVKEFPGGPRIRDAKFVEFENTVLTREIIKITDTQVRRMRRRLGLDKKSEEYDVAIQAVWQRHYKDIALLYRMFGTKGFTLISALQQLEAAYMPEIADEINGKSWARREES